MSKERHAMTANIKKLLEIVSGNKDLAAKVGSKCTCSFGGGDGNW